MGRVIAFSEFSSYLNDLSKGTSEFVRGTILDTNILISLTYEIKSDNDAVIDFVDALDDHGIELFTTVNTRSEYLDFNRRMTMTERLRGMLVESSKWEISSEKSRFNEPLPFPRFEAHICFSFCDERRQSLRPAKAAWPRQV